MKYLIKHGDAVMAVNDKTVYAKVSEGVFAECSESEATNIWDQTNDIAYMKDDVTFETTEVDIPEDFEFGKYLYVDGVFTKNPDWIEPPLPLDQQVQNLAAALAEQILLNEEMQAYQLEQDETILENDYNILLLQEGIADI